TKKTVRINCKTAAIPTNRSMTRYVSSIELGLIVLRLYVYISFSSLIVRCVSECITLIRSTNPKRGRERKERRAERADRGPPVLPFSLFSLGNQTLAEAMAAW